MTPTLLPTSLKRCYEANVLHAEWKGYTNIHTYFIFSFSPFSVETSYLRPIEKNQQTAVAMATTPFYRKAGCVSTAGTKKASQCKSLASVSMFVRNCSNNNNAGLQKNKNKNIL